MSRNDRPDPISSREFPKSSAEVVLRTCSAVLLQKMPRHSKNNTASAFFSAAERKKLKYGTRICPETGDKILSSDFGTAVHQRLEEVLNNRIDSRGLNNETSPYDEWVEPFIDYIDEIKYFDSPIFQYDCFTVLKF